MEHPFGLTMRTVQIRDVVLGGPAGVTDGVLRVDADAIRSLVLEDARIADVALEVARPGESVRIIHCLDAVEPRCKVGDGVVFPGILGPVETVGTGTTVRLAGMSVLTSSRYPQPFTGLLQAREAVVDMAGESSNYSPFGRVLNLVLVLTPNPAVENDDYDDAIRRAAALVAEHVAKAAVDVPPDGVTEWDFSTRHPDLPRVVYFYQLQGQGRMADTFLYGHDIHNLVPTLIHPTEVLDGAIMSGVYVYGCYKNPTWMHQNNPIIWELQRRHGTEIDFVGVILNRGHNYTQTDKERSSHWAAKLAGMLQADGAVLTAEGGGNSAIDMMLACQYMEKMGIRTTVVSSEAAGADGYDFPLFYTVPEADAIVSIGSEDEVFTMPEVERVIGPDETLTLMHGEFPARGPIDLKMYYQYCGTNQLGGNVLTGRVF